jgi:hypothetical protein
MTTFRFASMAALATVVACLLGFASTSQAARIISINANEASNRVPMAATDLAGAPGVRVGNWNNYASGGKTLPGQVTSPTSGTLIYSDGTAVPASFQVTTSGEPGYVGTNTLVNDRRMYSGAHHINSNSGSASMTVTFSDIPFTAYDLYIYAQGQNVSGSNFRGGSVELGSEIFYTQGGASPQDDGSGYVPMTTTSIPTSPVESDIAFGNYAVFDDLSGSSQTVTLTSYLWTDYARLQLYGYQIVEQVSDTQPIPEPTVLGVLGLGALALLRRR